MKPNLTKQDRIKKIFKKSQKYEEILSPFRKQIVKTTKDSEIGQAVLKLTGPTVYVIKCHKYYKIGVTQNSVEDRIGGLQVGNPYKLEIIYCLKCIDAKFMETKLHERYKHKKVIGEWFEFNNNDLEDFENFIKNGWK